MLMRPAVVWGRSTGVCSCLFFFQAEDGIRDYKVTGVQTCALPILKSETGGAMTNTRRLARATLALLLLARVAIADPPPNLAQAKGGPPPESAIGRSEERRVGKECRSRWSPDH